jgi:hypothetical protein
MDNPHPNATVSTVAGLIATLAIWALGIWTAARLTAEDGSLITVTIISLSLLIGRHVLKGLCSILWKGDPGD